MPLYFAYGSNMDVVGMAKRCPRSPARPRQTHAAPAGDHARGLADRRRDPRSNVHGVVWDLALADVAALDRFEGLAAGLYAKAVQPVVLPGGPKRALVYFGANAGPGRANADYIGAVYRGGTALASAARGPDRARAAGGRARRFAGTPRAGNKSKFRRFPAELAPTKWLRIAFRPSPAVIRRPEARCMNWGRVLGAGIGLC